MKQRNSPSLYTRKNHGLVVEWVKHFWEPYQVMIDKRDHRFVRMTSRKLRLSKLVQPK